jgi:hypothetical protein
MFINIPTKPIQIPIKTTDYHGRKNQYILSRDKCHAKTILQHNENIQREKYLTNIENIELNNIIPFKKENVIPTNKQIKCNVQNNYHKHRQKRKHFLATNNQNNEKCLLSNSEPISLYNTYTCLSSVNSKSIENLQSNIPFTENFINYETMINRTSTNFNQHNSISQEYISSIKILSTSYPPTISKNYHNFITPSILSYTSKEIQNKNSDLEKLISIDDIICNNKVKIKTNIRRKCAYIICIISEELFINCGGKKLANGIFIIKKNYDGTCDGETSAIIGINKKYISELINSTISDTINEISIYEILKNCEELCDVPGIEKLGPYKLTIINHMLKFFHFISEEELIIFNIEPKGENHNEKLYPYANIALCGGGMESIDEEKIDNNDKNEFKIFENCARSGL